MPKVTGGQAEGPNPEQLFAMVYACESGYTHCNGERLAGGRY